MNKQRPAADKLQPKIKKLPSITDTELAQFDLKKCVRVVLEILASSDEEFQSRDFLLGKALEFGLFGARWEKLARWTQYMNVSGFGLLQIPTEYIDYLRYVSKMEITTALEIGVHRGASAYFSAAVLQRANPELLYTIVDIEDRVWSFNEFAQHLNLRKNVPGTSKDFVGQEFDLVFIDGDHSYAGSKRDFLFVGRHARKAVAFHDVRGNEYSKQEGGITRTWQEIKVSLADTHTIVEFSHSPTPWMGIGVASQN